MLSGVTRQEALALAGISSAKLTYLEKVDVVVPTRIGGNCKPIVLLSLEQLIIATAFNRLRDCLTLEEVRFVAHFVCQSGYRKIQSRQIILINDRVALLDDNAESLGNLLRQCIKPIKKVQEFNVKILPPLEVFADQILVQADRWQNLDALDIKKRLGLVNVNVDLVEVN